MELPKRNHDTEGALPSHLTNWLLMTFGEDNSLCSFFYVLSVSSEFIISHKCTGEQPSHLTNKNVLKSFHLSLNKEELHVI